MRAIKYISIILLVTIVLNACTKEFVTDNSSNQDKGNTEQIIFNGNEIGSGVQEFEITQNHTIKKGVYVLKGWVYVTNGATLTIEPGTVIKGDKATKATLVVERGGKIIAQGSPEEPIVFTSNQPKGQRKPGDWGGLVLCGKAKNNKLEMIVEGGLRTKHGGDNDSDNSGVLSYVRVEFGGYPFKADQEINGLTFGSVGSNTKIDHIQVSYSNDDSYEWFGGTVNAKYLIAYHGWDDEFDTDNGFRGKIQFCLGIRNPKIADISRSNGFESDNESGGTTMAPLTKPIFSNVTFVGPIGQDPLFNNTASFIDGGAYIPGNGSKLGQFQSAIQIRRSSNLNCFNTVAMGYPVGIMICNDKGSLTQEAAEAGSINLKNIYMAGVSILGCDKDGAYIDQLSKNATTLDPNFVSFSSTFFNKVANNNVKLNTIQELGINQPSSLFLSPNYGPLANSPLVGKSNLFTDIMLNDSFFDKVNFIGAFRSDAAIDNWMLKWTNFDPQNTNY